MSLQWLGPCLQVGKNAESEMHFYVMPCGGAVHVELTLKGEAVVPRKLIYGYERFRVKNPSRGQRYVLRVTASNSEELRRISAVEVSTLRLFIPGQGKVRSGKHGALERV
jgi:hypothetical protein